MSFQINGKAAIIIAVLIGIQFVLGLVEFVTSPMFVFQQATEPALWAAWPAEDASDWETYRMAHDGLLQTALLAQDYTNSIGWLNPIAHASYQQYFKNSMTYVYMMGGVLCRNQPILCPDYRKELP